MSESDVPTNERTAGEQLRIAREAAGLTVADVAGKLKLSSRQISAIEDEDWDALPERTFTRGFFRSYARLLGLDDKVIDSAFVKTEPVNEMRALHAGIGEVAPDNTPARTPVAKWSIPVALLICLAAGIAWFLWQDVPMPPQSSKLPLSEVSRASAKSEQQNSQSPLQNSSSADLVKNTIDTKNDTSAPVTGGLLASANIDLNATKAAPPAEPTKPAAAETVTPGPLLTAVQQATASTSTAATSPSRLAVAPGQKRVNLVVTGRSWAEIRSRGEVVASETLTDSSREFALTPPLSFVVGNASNVKLSIDGKPYDFSMHVRNEVARFRVE